MGLFSRDNISELVERRDFEKLVHLARKPKTRDEAIAALDSLRDPAMIEPAVDIWDDFRTGEEDKEAIVGVLKAMGPDTVIPRLVEIVEEADKFLAVDVIARVGGGSALPVLRDFAFRGSGEGKAKGSSFVRKRCFREAIKLGSPEGRQLVLDGLADEWARADALDALFLEWETDDGEFLEVWIREVAKGGPRDEEGEPRAGSDLATAVKAVKRWARKVEKHKTGDEGGLKQAKQEAFEEYAGDAGIAKLVELLADDDAAVRRAAIWGLGQALGSDTRPEPDVRMADALARVAAEDTEPSVRVAAACGLSYQSDPRAGVLGMDALEAAIAAEEPGPAKRMAFRLRFFHEDDPIPRRSERARACLEAYERSEALQAINRLDVNLKALA